MAAIKKITMMGNCRRQTDDKIMQPLLRSLRPMGPPPTRQQNSVRTGTARLGLMEEQAKDRNEW